MAIAIIEIEIPGYESVSGLKLHISDSIDSDTFTVNTLDLTALTNRKSTYRTTTSAALTGKRFIKVTTGSPTDTEIAIGYVLMDDTATVHRVSAEPWMANVASTQVEFDTLQVGPFLITIHVEDGDGNPIEDAEIALYRTGDARHGVSNVDGDKDFSSTAVTWTTVAITADGFQFTTAPITVTANETFIFVGTPIPAVIPTDPPSVTGIIKTYDEYGDLEAGVIVYVQMKQQATPTGAFDSKIATYTSDSGGIVSIPRMFQTAIYDIWRGSTNIAKQSYQVPVTTEGEVELPSLIGDDTLDPCLTQ